MVTRESFLRSTAIRLQQRTLAASTYNLVRILQSRSRPEALFVPIRTMLFLAVIDDEEIVFIDGAVSRRNIELAWQDFRSRERASLDDPVAYPVVHYTRSSLNLMQRLQGEFHRALEQLRDKSNAPLPALVIPLRR